MGSDTCIRVVLRVVVNEPYLFFLENTETLDRDPEGSKPTFKVFCRFRWADPTGLLLLGRVLRNFLIYGFIATGLARCKGPELRSAGLSKDP